MKICALHQSFTSQAPVASGRFSKTLLSPSLPFVGHALSNTKQIATCYAQPFFLAVVFFVLHLVTSCFNQSVHQMNSEDINISHRIHVSYISIYPIHVSIYTSTMEHMGMSVGPPHHVGNLPSGKLTVRHRPWQSSGLEDEFVRLFNQNIAIANR